MQTNLRGGAMSLSFKHAIIIVVILAVFGFGLFCGDNKFYNPLPTDFVYPMKIGNKWNYAGIARSFNVQPDSLKDEHELTYVTRSTLEIISDTTLMDSIDVFILAELYIMDKVDSDTFNSENYFVNLDDGLYYYGHAGTSSQAKPYKIAPLKIFYKFNGREYHNLHDLFNSLGRDWEHINLNGDSIHYVLPPRKGYHYPLSIGEEWIVLETPGFYTIGKKVVGIVNVEVPAGRFQCYKIQWLWDMDQDGEWESRYEYYDYIAAVGLVKRIMIVRDIEIVTYEHPTGRGTFNLEIRFELTDYIIQ
jgi:hypothetical protein